MPMRFQAVWKTEHVGGGYPPYPFNREKSMRHAVFARPKV